MRNLVKTTLSLAAAAIILPALSFAGGRSIYGEDNRTEYFSASAGVKALSDSVVSFWKSASLETQASGEIKLQTVKFGDRLNLCAGEKFREQPIGAFCSGSLVGEDLVMTAGHCVKTEEDCKNTKMVFGFAVKTAGGEATTSVPAGEVYGCARIVKRFLGGEPGSVNPAGQTLGPDFALVQLDRKVTGHKPLLIDRNSALKKGSGVFVIGHPVGLPLKIAGSASVRDFSKIGYFTTNLDTFGGNSGSPVFNAKNNLVEGILVRGDNDFNVTADGCRTMATYAQTGGRGEDVTKIAALSEFIPVLSGREAPAKTAGADGTVGMDSSGLQSLDLTPSRTVSFD